ncbi:hypothetical protein EW145_g3855 [Phellinidium pouzarii]|uniref:DOMON domain-containing protein n=1 Tax=Phellinidium pouzarii TaxID=167371 RepID=A0A4S4L7H2_9AGAM|nr:hypothetical protein EW145_g3855 [Phellinidium pouzarii]
MIWRFSLIFLVLSLVARQSHAGNVQGDNFCGDLMCTTAFVNSTAITYQMTALTQMGWMAVGFGTQMTDAKMVIMWPNSDGSISLSQRTATGHVEPVPDPSPPRIATTYQPLTTISSTMNTLSFTVPKDDTVNQSAVWALSFTNPDSTSPNASLIIHNDSGAFTLNLSKEFDPNITQIREWL